MKYSINNFKDEVVKCLDTCKRCLQIIESGAITEYTYEQITGVIIPEMEMLLIQIKNNDFPCMDQRFIKSFSMAFKEWC